MNKKKNHQVSHLSGSPKEQAKQLLDILKDRSLDIESLKVLLPANVEVIKEFIVCLQSDLTANQAAYDRVIGIFEGSIQTLREIIKDGNIDEEEKKRVLDVILSLHQQMICLQSEHEKNILGFWKDVVKWIFSILGIIIVVTTGIKGLPSKKA